MVTPSKPPPPYEQLLPLPTPCFKMFLERSLNDPPPPTTPLQAPFTATPSPSTTPSPPPKNFDRTHIYHVPFKGQLQRFYKLMSYQKELSNVEMICVSLKSAKPFSSYEALKMGRGILIEDRKCRFPTLEFPITAENDVILKQ